MIKKILVFVLLSFLVSCGSSRSKIQTSKNATAKNRAKTERKAKNRKRNDTRTATVSNSKKRDSETLEATSKTTVYTDVVKAYINQYKETAKDNMRNHGVPASITLAQGILESGAGRGTLCINANNHFGIKCHTGWEGEKVYHDDDAKGECFRKYDDPADSYNDHSLFLTSRGRYASLFKLDKDDYKGWAHGLKAAGYATDPKYPDKLISLIERYDLDGYDAEVLGRSYKPEPRIESQTPIAVASGMAAGERGTYTVVQGDTLYSISKKHNLTVDELMKINGLNSNAISIGQILKVK